MNTPPDTFAARLSADLHKSLDAIRTDDLPWVDVRQNLRERARRRHRRSYMKATAAVLATAVAVTAVIVVAQPSHRRSTGPITPGQPEPLHIVATTPTGDSTPAALASGGGWVFAVLWDSGRLVRLDPVTLRTTATVQVGSARNGPLAVTFGAGAVWLLNFADGRLWRVDPSTMKPTLKVTLPAQPSQVAFGDGAVWVTVCCTSDTTVNRQRLLRVDPVTGATTGSRQVAGDGETVSLAVGRAVFVTSQNGPILGVDPITMNVALTLPNPCADCGGATGLAAGDQGLYTTSLTSVLRYDSKSGRLLAETTQTAAVGRPLGVQPDGVWFAEDDRLLRLDPVTLAITAQAPIAVTGQLVELKHSIYVSVAGHIERLETLAH